MLSPPTGFCRAVSTEYPAANAALTQADLRQSPPAKAVAPPTALTRALSLSLSLSRRMRMDEDGGILDAVVLKLNPTRTRYEDCRPFPVR